MISFHPFSDAGHWPGCPSSQATPADCTDTSNHPLHKLNQVKVHHSSRMAAQPAVALPGHIFQQDTRSSHQSPLPHTLPDCWTWLFHIWADTPGQAGSTEGTSHTEPPLHGAAPSVSRAVIPPASTLRGYQLQRQHPHPPTGFLQLHSKCWFGDAASWIYLAQGHRWSCGMWFILNSACYYGISSVFQYLKCSGRETGSAKKPWRRGLNVLKVTLHYARPGEGQE